MEDIRKALEDVIKTERDGIQKKLDEMKQKAQQGAGDLSPETVQKIVQSMDEKAAQNLAKTGQSAQRCGRAGQRAEQI